ncbi:hypothetical protein BGZ65_011341 [Modicella reniformis]|uniref:Uncharacterized protein n=1 Tax=Modicella reniformis TaxID=1440133 RepID=A0A9P6JFL0_9FUNG|nr:hypothetical protein BGZ65_011341 [Modicella reniformis]
MSIEDYQRKKNNGESKVDTPKAASESPASTSAAAPPGKPSTGSKETSQKSSSVEHKSSNSGSTSSSTKPSPETQKKIADYFNTFRLRRAEGITHKHSADDTLKNNNPKLGAIQYFLSAIEFIAAFHANDKYHNLSNPGRPEVAVKESIASWETMRQFIYALTNQCHSNHLAGLDGVSALMEVLVYNKVYNFHASTLRKEMIKSGQFKNKASAVKDENGTPAPTVAISQEMAGRMFQNLEDWAHIQKRLDDCRLWLTPDIARDQFPDTFRKWCIHPDQIGQAGKDFGRFVPGTSIQKMYWPLGTHLHLHELMGFVELALNEFQRRKGIDARNAGANK